MDRRSRFECAGPWDLVLKLELPTRQSVEMRDQVFRIAIGGNAHGSAYISMMVASISSVMEINFAEA